MTRKLMYSIQTVEEGGLIVTDRVYPEKQYVFADPKSFYLWLCQQMGTNAKPDSPTTCGRVVVDALKLERLEVIQRAAERVSEQPFGVLERQRLAEALRCYASLSE